MYIAGQRGIERPENKTILLRTSGSAAVPFNLADGNAHIAAHITFNEAKIGIAAEEVATTLMRFASRVSEIIKLFDIP